MLVYKLASSKQMNKKISQLSLIFLCVDSPALPSESDQHTFLNINIGHA